MTVEKGTTYFRVLPDKGHQVLLLEVHRLANTGQQTIYSGTGTNCVLLDSLHAIWIFTWGKVPTRGILEKVEVIFVL